MPTLRRSLLGALLVFGCTPKPKQAPQGEAPPPFEPKPLQVAEVELPPRALPASDGVTAEAPFKLTASDGTGLEVVSLKARAVVQGPLAFTELHLTFDNPESRTIEGRFQIDLPSDSAISRFAMKVAAGWQEGEVVERQSARKVYEDFLHRKQDPALLEKQAGNRFSARVFPIPANGRKELIVSYSQELRDGDLPYTLLLAGLPQLEQLDVQVLIDEATEGGPATSVGGVEATRRVIKLKEENFTPKEDLRVESRTKEDAIGLRSGSLAVARVPVKGSMDPQPIDDLTILFDTSASRSLGFDEKVRRLAELIDAIAAGSDVHLRVIAFDNEVAKLFDGKATDFSDAHMRALYSRRAMGASDLQGALERMKLAGVSSRIVLVTDGIATAGQSEVVDLQATITALGKAGLKRLDAVVEGGLRDEDVLQALTAALPTSGIVVDGALGAGQVVSKLTKSTYSDVKISVPGSAFVWPRQVSGVQPGDEVLVYADLPDDAKMTVVLTGDDEIGSATPRLTQVDRPLLERALVSARIDAKTLERSTLPTEDAAGREKLAEDIVTMSTKYRVLSDFTALLVLETEADYRRFNIDRNALADVLTVDAGGLSLVQRESLEMPFSTAGLGLQGTLPGRGTPGDPTMEIAPPPPPPADGGAFAKGEDDEDVWGGLDGSEVGEAFGQGGLGLVGTGRGGGGTGEGTIGLGNTGLIGRGGGASSGSGYGRGSSPGFGGRGRRVPRVRQAKAKVTGALDKDIIRRIVRAHINEVRHCYNQGLVRDPALNGKVTVRFTIAATGRVSEASLASSTIPDRRVSRCIVKAVERWKFPKPRGGGIVEVEYPFVLGAGGGTPVPPETEEERLAREAEEAKRLAEEAKWKHLDGYEGKTREVMKLLGDGSAAQALELALQWRDEAPGDVLALLALGEALEATHKPKEAARAYASLIDLFPARADLRRYAGYRLERLGPPGRAMAVDTYRHAVRQRPDHPNSHRLLAFALLRDAQLDEAMDAIETGVTTEYPSGRFSGVPRILREDMGLIAAAVLAKDPSKKAALEKRLAEHNTKIATAASTRFVMSWETDSNDVDFHIHDGKGGHAYYSDKTLDSGGSLYADVTTGYGPECFTIEGEPTAFPYRFEANYYSRGPMGYGMGKLEIIQHDGKGGLVFDQRPFVIMKDRAFVPLGTLEKPLVAPTDSKR
jgi:TonB family protein